MTMVSRIDHTAWRSIEYRPAIESLLPVKLLPYLRRGDTALDIGCGRGHAAMFLARADVSVLGVDLNTSAIDDASRQAEAEGLGARARFLAGDILDEQAGLGFFDVVVMVRTLTCFPHRQEWRQLLDLASSHIRPGGLIYVNDFLMTPENMAYQHRYEAGARLGWRRGTFPVLRTDGSLLFAAHHHSQNELEEILQPFEVIRMERYESVSMNGNPCSMFEMVGRAAS